MSDGVVEGAWSWRRAVIASNLPPTTKHILLTLSCHVPEIGDAAWPSVATLADETGLHPDTVRDHLKSVVGSWLARRERHEDSGRQTSNSWVLTMPRKDAGTGVVDPTSPPENRGEGGSWTPPRGGVVDPTPEKLIRKAQPDVHSELSLSLSDQTADPKPQRRKPKRRISEDYQPRPQDLAWAKAKFKIEDERLTELTEEFVTYWLDQGEARPGWHSTWRKNVERVAGLGNGNGNGYHGPKGPNGRAVRVTKVDGMRILDR